MRKLAAILGVFLAPSSALAQTPAEFFRGKTVHVIVEIGRAHV